MCLMSAGTTVLPTTKSARTFQVWCLSRRSLAVRLQSRQHRRGVCSSLLPQPIWTSGRGLTNNHRCSCSLARPLGRRRGFRLLRIHIVSSCVRPNSPANSHLHSSVLHEHRPHAHGLLCLETVLCMFTPTERDAEMVTAISLRSKIVAALCRKRFLSQVQLSLSFACKRIDPPLALHAQIMAEHVAAETRDVRAHEQQPLMKETYD